MVSVSGLDFSPPVSSANGTGFYPDRRGRSGFVLIVALTLMALLLAVMVSMSGLVRSGLEVGTESRNAFLARQNAIYGLRVALSELQTYAGPDQSATFSATAFYPQKSLNDPTASVPRQGRGPIFEDGSIGYRNFAEVSNASSYLDQVGTYLTASEREDWDAALASWWNDRRNPRLTGIVDTSLRVDRASDPGAVPAPLAPERYGDANKNGVWGEAGDYQTQFGEPKRDQLPAWIISGNERYRIDPETGEVRELGGGVVATNEYPDDYVTPLSEIGLPDDDVGTVWLVEKGTLDGVVLDGIDGRVKAPTVELKGDRDRTLGRFAYWVADESTKANFSVRDPYFESSEGSVEYRNRLQVPQRVGWENVAATPTETFADLATFDINDAKFEKVISSRAIPLAEETNPEDVLAAVRNNFHSLTGSSKSLLTDPALGGLKSDLTVFLETGAGLDPDDPIADVNRYAVGDSRFGAWGGGNDGFPFSDQTIPRWGQIRDWYQNEASGGSINPDADIAPLLVYYLMYSGWSYESATQTVRWHWIPMVMLWNPYDVRLSTERYDLQIGLSPNLIRVFVANPAPTLAELQQDADADWREVPVGPGGGATDPDGNPVLAPDGSEYTGGATDNALVRIFKGTREGNSNPRYYARIVSSNPESVDMTPGPWPGPATGHNPEDGATDAFGRYYYWLESADSRVDLRRGNDGASGNFGDLGNQEFHVSDLSPHTRAENDPDSQVDFPFRFQITDSFEPGQVKVFTVGTDTNWNKTSVVELENFHDPDRPSSLYYDIFEVPDGPVASNGKLRFYFLESNLGTYAPEVLLSIGGEPIVDASGGFGELLDNTAKRAFLGDEMADLDVNSKDSDGDGVGNRNEANPKYAHAWRILHDSSDFANEMLTSGAAGSTSYETRSSVWAYGKVWMQPFVFTSGTESLRMGDHLIELMPALSRFNIGARFIGLHPLVDAKRNKSSANNVWGAGTSPTRLDGLGRLNYVRTDSLNDNVHWDGDEVAGNEGYALVIPKQQEEVYRGLTRLSVRSARRAQSEVLSIGQFQQVDLSEYFWHPAFAIGNSYAPPYTDREAVAGLNSRYIGGDGIGNPIPPLPGKIRADPSNTTLDLSYLLNENLWDRYFLSSVPQAAGIDPNVPLPNSRHRFRPTALDSDPVDVKGFETSAAFLENVGALNVNSTSVDAWRSLLTAFRGLKLTGGGETNPAETAPVTRSLAPIGAAVDFSFGSIDAADIGAVPGDKDYSQLLNGFRYLDDDMIAALAERIVDEVRLRGPFFSVADFVNRRLVAPDGSNQPGSAWYEARTNGIVGAENGPGVVSSVSARFPPFLKSDVRPEFIPLDYDPLVGLQGLSGTLQRAIQLSGVNGGLSHPAPADLDRVFSVRFKDRGGIDFEMWDSFEDHYSLPTEYHIQDPAMRNHLDSEHLAGAPVGEAGQLLDGAPGFITQADLLSMIGPALTARGDTFLIRTYGDAIGPNGEVVARAWVEATVQRIPDPVVPAGTSGSDRWKPSNKLGRKFEIISFRWLSPDEI